MQSERAGGRPSVNDLIKRPADKWRRTMGREESRREEGGAARTQGCKIKQTHPAV